MDHLFAWVQYVDVNSLQWVIFTFLRSLHICCKNAGCGGRAVAVPSECLARISPIASTSAGKTRVTNHCHEGSVRPPEVRQVVIGQHRPPANSSVCKNRPHPPNTSVSRPVLFLPRKGRKGMNFGNKNIKKFNKLDALIFNTIFKDLGECKYFHFVDILYWPVGQHQVTAHWLR